MIRISLIIPAYNEEAFLPNLLESVKVARDRFEPGPESVEVILADNGSTDHTVPIAQEWGCRVVHEARRIIGAVRNRGSRAAGGEILAFTDADNTIHSDTFNQIDQVMSSPKILGGSTGVHLERMSPGIAAAYFIIVPMVWVTGFDTGVVFCRKEDFITIGGYDERLLFAEDVRFLWSLQKLGRKKGQRLVRLRKYKAVTSTRKFDRFGDWHYVGLVFKFFVSLILPRYSIEKFARTYWYSD